MKRDWGLVVEVLEAVECEELQEIIDDLNIKNKTKAELFVGHLWLCLDAGLIVGSEVYISSSGEKNLRIDDDLRLTMEGHDILESMRNDGFYKKVLLVAKKASIPVTIELMKTVIANLARTSM